MSEATENSITPTESKPPQISADVLADLNLTQAEIDSDYKNKEQEANAEAALTKGDWKTAATIYDEIKDGGIGGESAHDIRVKMAEIFKEDANTRREIAVHIQSLIDARLKKEPATREAVPAKEQTPQPSEPQPNLTSPTINTETPTQPVKNIAAEITTAAETAATIPTPIEPSIKKVIPFPHLASSRTINPTTPDQTPILNVSGEVTLNPNTAPSTDDLRAAPPNPLNQAA